jgi:Family of unknown function (DUF5677)
VIEGLERVEYEPYEPDWRSLGETDQEDVFAEAAFELLKDIAQTNVVAVCIEERDDEGAPIPMTRDAAILGALLVRCMKLTHGLLQTASDRRMELLNLFIRPLIESAVNLRFLLELGNPDVFQDFVVYSFRADRQLRERIRTHITEAGGTATPIQARILDSIDRSLKRSGVGQDDRPTGAWPQRIFDRFDQLGLNDEYLFQFSVQSHYVHGNWHELLSYHLRKHEGGFLLDTSWGDVRPQPLLAATLVLGQATRSYLDTVPMAAPERALLVGRLERAVARVLRVGELHESFLTKRS